MFGIGSFAESVELCEEVISVDNGGVSSVSEGEVLLPKVDPRGEVGDSSSGSNKSGGGEERGEELQNRGGSERGEDSAAREVSTLLC